MEPFKTTSRKMKMVSLLGGAIDLGGSIASTSYITPQQQASTLIHSPRLGPTSPSTLKRSHLPEKNDGNNKCIKVDNQISSAPQPESAFWPNDEEIQWPDQTTELLRGDRLSESFFIPDDDEIQWPDNNKVEEILRAEGIQRGGADEAPQPGCSFWSDERGEPNQIEGECINTAFQNRVATWRIPARGHNDIKLFLKNKKNTIIYHINEAYKKHGALKINLRLQCEMHRGEESMKTMFKTKNFIFLGNENIDMIIEEANNKILKELEEYSGKGSGWVLSRILFLDICINVYRPIRGSSYIELPPFIKLKEACVNIVNNDQKCFAYAVLAMLHPQDRNPNRVSKYKPFINTLDFTGIEFPVALRDIPKFEKLNSINVTVIGYENFFFPLYMNTKMQYDRSVDLLYITDEQTSHYCYIKNLSRLLSSTESKHDHQHFFCRNCLGFYQTQEKLSRHQIYCLNNQTARIDLPDDKKNILKFEDVWKSHKVPFIIYADFESILVPGKGKVLHQHVASSYCYYIKNMYSRKEEKLKLFRGKEDVGAHFFKSICEDVKLIYANYLSLNKPMDPLTPAQEEDFKNCKFCPACKKSFQPSNEKCHDHDHILGKYRGVLCKTCNLNCQIPQFIPILLHNFSKYDCHLFVKALSDTDYSGDVHVLPHTEEDYIALTRIIKVGNKSIQLRFIDSFRFLSSSLENLVNSLDKNQFHNMNYFYPDKPLLLRKGVFPYEYIDKYEKYNDSSLPIKDHFYSRLTDTHISDEDYDHALKVWDAFNISSLGAYSDLYLKCDVLLLADVFENFRATCLNQYGLDPAHFYTAPGLSWTAMLKFTNIKLQLLQDHDMIMFVEQGIRGGISQVSQRHAIANNKYMNDYKSDQPSNYLMYVDINNLYGWSMSQYLPQSQFTWMSSDEIDQLDIFSILDTDDIGYIVEVDLDYPESLHDVHNNFPCAPKKEIVREDWLSPYLGENYKPSKCKKLLTTLYPKRNYVVHYRTLKLYVQLGLVMTKIHRGIKFFQAPWLKPYIEHNTKLRQEATDDFGRDFFKLMVNAIFGKTMQNVRNHQDITLCNSWKKACKLIAKPSFKSCTTFTDELVAVHRYKEKVYFNKPIYVGMSILDISKFNIYNFHYNIMVPKYGNNIQCLYHDTDSFIYAIQTADVYHDIGTDENLKKHFDTSNFPIQNPYGLIPNQENRLVLGLMKDENKGNIMTDFIGIRSKMYTTRVRKTDGNTHIVKKIKGIKKVVIQNKISFEDYENCLLKKQPQYETNICIKSEKHDLKTIAIYKKALCDKDDKKYISIDGIYCKSYGHYSLLPLLPTP